MPFDNEPPLPEERARAYDDHGFDRAIVSVPSEALAELVDDVFDDLLEEGLDEPNEDRAGYELAEGLYPIYQRLERALRILIMRSLETGYGDAWIRKFVPEDMRKRWEGRREIERERGLPARELIFYADFNDYQQIILRKDLWESTFKVIFKRKENVTEAFYRASPARNCISHGRPVLRQEALFARVEIQRLWIAIGPFLKR